MVCIMEKDSFPVIDINRDFAIAQVDNQIRLYEHPHRLTQGIFVFCLSGECTFFLNLAEYKIKAHDFITVPPGSILQFQDRSDDYKSYVILFSSGFLTSIDLVRGALFFSTTVGEYPVLSLGNEEALLLRDYCDLLQRIFYRRKLDAEPVVIRHMLISLFYSVSGIYLHRFKTKEVTTFNRQEEIYHRLCKLIMEHYKTQRSVVFYAGLLCLSPRYLTAVVKKVSGRLVSQMIERVVIMDAKLQLKSTDRTVQQIADDLNFSNPSFFGKFFKRYTGLTPKQYRES